MYVSDPKFQLCRSHLLNQQGLAHSLAQYFGSEKAVPGDSCGMCTQCTTGQGVAFNPDYVAAVDPSALRAVLAACPDRDDPRLIVRFAVGITSPRLTTLKLSSHPLFGSMVGTNHDLLLAAIDAECAAAGYTPAPEGASNFSPPKKRTVSASSSTSKRGKASTSTSRSTSGSSYKKSSYSPYGGSSSRGSSRGGYRGGRR